jgi:hypothetical protein
MTTVSRAFAFVATAILAVGIAMPAKADLVKELIPTGKLRVAIATAVAVPKDKQDALAYVTAFIEEAKADGLVRKALDAMNLQASQVAPAGMKP